MTSVVFVIVTFQVCFQHKRSDWFMLEWAGIFIV